MSNQCFNCEHYYKDLSEGDRLCHHPKLKAVFEKGANTGFLIEGMLLSLGEIDNCPFWHKKISIRSGKLESLKLPKVREDIQLVLNLPRDFDLAELEKALMQALSSLRNMTVKTEVKTIFNPFTFEEAIRAFDDMQVQAVKEEPVKEEVTLAYEMEKPLDKPTDYGMKLYEETGGYYEGIACTCTEESCGGPGPCKGQCGCLACQDAYADFLSLE